MAKVTPEEFAVKHANRLKASTEDIRRGVERVTVAPGKLAAAKKDKMRTNLLKKIDDGTWAERVGAYPLEEWRKDMAGKGVNRISEGIDGAHDKQVKFAGQLLPYQDSIKKDLEKLPDITLEDNINRMTTFVRGMAKFKKKP